MVRANKITKLQKLINLIFIFIENR